MFARFILIAAIVLGRSRTYSESAFPLSASRMISGCVGTGVGVAVSTTSKVGTGVRGTGVVVNTTGEGEGVGAAVGEHAASIRMISAETRFNINCRFKTMCCSNCLQNAGYHSAAPEARSSPE